MPHEQITITTRDGECPSHVFTTQAHRNTAQFALTEPSQYDRLETVAGCIRHWAMPTPMAFDKKRLANQISLAAELERLGRRWARSYVSNVSNRACYLDDSLFAGLVASVYSKLRAWGRDRQDVLR